ncbi:NTP transferase domain-containing protein [Rhodobacterales bacterium HKCCE3408]|nr:NTP transferase domain-containing protein [Rhodobacterales bacterium HKCCE3408]
MRGADKLLQEIDGTPILRVVAARAVQVAPVRVVLRADQDARRQALDGLDLEIVAVDGEAEMSASLRAGVAGLKGPVMVVLPDMPAITAEDMATLSALWQAGAAPILRAATEDGRPGHPVILPPDMLKKIATLQGDHGAGPLLKAEAGRTGLYPLPGNRALIDLDTPEDWADWRASKV